MVRIVTALLLVVASSGAVIAWLVYEGRISVPERDNPFLPLDVRAAPGLLTPWKFWRATHDPEADGRLSEHAYANAIDVEAFELADGSRMTIAQDWNADSRAGRLLARIRTGACDYFHAVLGPDYNALHRTHFHLDMGPYRVCE